MRSNSGILRRHWQLWVALVVVLLGRIALYGWPITPDESGFYLVADSLLQGEGDNLYGHYWVDRPPVLIWCFTFAAAIGKVEAIRWLVTLFFLAFVTLTYAVVRRLGGAAGWAAAVAAAFSITPEVGAQVANGEAFAIPLVMGSILCVVIADGHQGARALLWSAASGVAGMLAMGVKQNFLEGLVFAFVLVIASGLRGERAWPDVARRLLAGVGGIITAVLAMVAFAVTTGAGVAGLWLAAVSFRGDASRVIHAGYRTGIENRADAISGSAWAAGIIPLLIVLVLVAAMGRLRGSAASWAVAAVIGVEVAGILIGGNFWLHYLLGLAPGLALAAGLAAQLVGRRWMVIPVASYAVISALVVVPSTAMDMGPTGTTRTMEAGRFVAMSAAPGDTSTTLFGRAEAQLATGLSSPYEHLWSLPVRVLDPDLSELTEVLRGDDAPTWLIQVFALDEWGLDPTGQAGVVIRQRYELVYDTCQTRVYKLTSAHRTLAQAPTCR